MELWFWAMNSYFWRVAAVTGREGPVIQVPPGQTGQAAYLLVPNPGACHVCARYHAAGAISMGSV